MNPHNNHKLPEELPTMSLATTQAAARRIYHQMELEQRRKFMGNIFSMLNIPDNLR